MIVMIQLALSALVILTSPASLIAVAQGTPISEGVAESDALWGGNYVAHLPSCKDSEICLAALYQAEPGERYYFGIIQNRTQQWVKVHDASVSLFDPQGDLAAIGEIYFLSPSIISPGGHAILQVQTAGEFISQFTFEARFDYEPSNGGDDGDGVPVRIDSATLRGDAILAQFTNTSNYTFDSVWAYSACFADDGSILDIDQEIVDMGPFESGDSARFALEPRGDRECDNFVVTANGDS